MSAEASVTGRAYHIPGVTPGSPEWLQYMSASKIAAVMGHSTYDSYFSLWHRMKGNIPQDPGSDEAQRGVYLEPAILAWFHDQHPDWSFTKTRMWIHPDHPRYSATPDEIVHTDKGKEIVEAKSSGLAYEWGEPGTDQIPAGHYDQVQWQMYCTGLTRAWVPMIGLGLNFAEYVVDYNPDYVKQIVDRVAAFMHSLELNQKPSMDPLDGHTETYRAVRELNPGITDETVDVSDEHAVPFLDALAASKDAEYTLQAAKNVLADIAGEAHYVRWNDQKLLTRQSKGGGTPYFVAASGLHTLKIEATK